MFTSVGNLNLEMTERLPSTLDCVSSICLLKTKDHLESGTELGQQTIKSDVSTKFSRTERPQSTPRDVKDTNHQHTYELYRRQRRDRNRRKHKKSCQSGHGRGSEGDEVFSFSDWGLKGQKTTRKREDLGYPRVEGKDVTPNLRLP